MNGRRFSSPGRVLPSDRTVGLALGVGRRLGLRPQAGEVVVPRLERLGQPEREGRSTWGRSSRRTTARTSRVAGPTASRSPTSADILSSIRMSERLFKSFVRFDPPSPRPELCARRRRCLWGSHEGSRPLTSHGCETRPPFARAQGPESRCRPRLCSPAWIDQAHIAAGRRFTTLNNQGDGDLRRARWRLRSPAVPEPANRPKGRLPGG